MNPFVSDEWYVLRRGMDELATQLPFDDIEEEERELEGWMRSAKLRAFVDLAMSEAQNTLPS